MQIDVFSKIQEPYKVCIHLEGNESDHVFTFKYTGILPPDSLFEKLSIKSRELGIRNTLVLLKKTAATYGGEYRARPRDKNNNFRPNEFPIKGYHNARINSREITTFKLGKSSKYKKEREFIEDYRIDIATGLIEPIFSFDVFNNKF